ASSATHSESSPSPKVAKNNSLINEAEDDYTAGLDDYQSGDMARAKQEFDNALSVLLESKPGVLANNRLIEEFDLLTDNINQVELSAIEQGNSLSAHQYVPTPIESFAGLTFPPNPAVMQRIRQEMLSIHSDIPLVTNQSVSGAIAYLTQHARGYVTSVLEGLDKYGPMITQTLRQDGLPQDLVYLPGPESAYKPHAESRKGARGMWQLMAGTAELYGLRVNRAVDEREDPYRSTMVAARDLKALYHEFGDWYLALAAYDSGPGTVQRAIQNTGYADYWTLRKLHALPAETESYVPVFLATALIAKDPGAYGFNVKAVPPLREDHVRVSTPTDLRLVANLLDCSADELAQLNPGLRAWVTPADDPGFVLNLPAGTQSQFEQRIAAVPAAERRWWRARKIQAGDTLRSVAAYYRISPVRLAEANHLSLQDPLGDGSYLLIPLAPSFEVARGRARWVRRAFRYRIRRGDNLDLIADRFDVTTYQIRRWNHLRSSRLVAGRSLLIYRLVPVRYGVRPVRRRRVVRRRSVERASVAQRDPKGRKSNAIARPGASSRQ
ncbi:MAG: transglycosylase SLT domain-containing protein, partial [Terriglobia bacterium]